MWQNIAVVLQSSGPPPRPGDWTKERSNNPPLNAVEISQDVILEPADNNRLANLCGQFDEHLRQIDNDVLINISTMKMAIRGRIVWRDDPDAGISLMWNTARKAPGPRF